jgi:hypothetical protein
MKGGAKVVCRDFGREEKVGRLLPVRYTTFVEYKTFGLQKERN